MKYLVLGANSFYGSNFVRLLQEKCETVVPSIERLADVVFFAQYDWVVNFASKSLVEESWAKPGEWLQTNVLDTCKLFERLRVHGSPYMHISTPEVYGSNADWVGESAKFRPSTPYAVSRAAADMMLKAYWKAYKFPMIITRTANIYGPGQQEYRLIPKTFNLLRAGKKFPIQGKGNSIRSFIHVGDACEALYLITKKGEIGQTYHISTLKAHSTLDVVRMISRTLGKYHEMTYEFVPERLGKDKAYLLNSSKIRGLGWSDTIQLEKGLEDYANRTAVREGSAEVPSQAREALQGAG